MGNSLQSLGPGQSHLNTGIHRGTLGVPIGHRVELEVGIVRQSLDVVDAFKLNESRLGRNIR